MKKLRWITLAFYILFLAAGCASKINSHQQIEGSFTSRTNEKVKLVIHNKNFALIDSRESGDLGTLCCDTITFGTVRFPEAGLMVLNSDPSLNSIFIDMDVIEQQSASLDSIIFDIRNPIETNYQKYNGEGSDLTYTLIVQPNANSISYFQENNQAFGGNRIAFYNPKRLSIDNFMLVVVPKRSIPVKQVSINEIHTLEYKVKDKRSNHFEISLPQLSYGFISYKRLKDDYAKVINQNKIIWDGSEFIK